jgi:hypothetical protein
VVAICAATLLACAPGIPFDVYNGAGTQITITHRGQSDSLEPGEMKSFLLVDGTNVCLFGDLLTYDFSAPDPALYRRSGGFPGLQGHYRVQIDPKGRLHVLRNDAEFPVSANIPQPPGYPLVPARAGRC